MSSTKSLVDFLDDGLPDVRVSWDIKPVILVDEAIADIHPWFEFDLGGELSKAFYPVLVVDGGDSEDVSPGDGIGYLVLGSWSVDDDIVELGHVGEPSCLFGSDLLLVLDIGDCVVVSDNGDLVVGK